MGLKEESPPGGSEHDNDEHGGGALAFVLAGLAQVDSVVVLDEHALDLMQNRIQPDIIIDD